MIITFVQSVLAMVETILVVTIYHFLTKSDDHDDDDRSFFHDLCNGWLLQLRGRKIKQAEKVESKANNEDQQTEEEQEKKKESAEEGSKREKEMKKEGRKRQKRILHAVNRAAFLLNCLISIGSVIYLLFEFFR